MRSYTILSFPLKGFGIVAKTLLLSFCLVVLAACQFGTPVPNGDPAAQARVTAVGTGLFKVSQRTLANMGWTAETPLKMTFRDREIPFEVHGNDLYFYLADDTSARYSNRHVLWLRSGTAASPASVSTGLASVSQVTTLARLGAEEQYSSQHAGDPWFWRTLTAPSSETFSVQTPNRLEGKVEITLKVAGVTKITHHIEVMAEDQSAGTVTWEDLPRYTDTLSVTLPAGNDITLTLTVPEGEEGVDISLLDQIVVQYPGTPTLREGIFLGNTTTAGQVSFANANDIFGWQLTPTLAPLPLSEGEEGKTIGFPQGGSVVVVQPDKAVEASAERVESASIGLSNEGAEYIAIVDPTLSDAVKPLLEYHRESGMSVAEFTPQQLYDTYSAGIIDPLAFHDMLKDGMDHWKVKPKYVLIVGDTTYDPSGYLNEVPAAYIPSPFVNSVYGGETVSDNVIADVDDDGYPDVALGRIPARIPEEAAIAVRKTVDYSKNPEEGAWRDRVVFAADGRESIFKDTSERLRTTYVPSSVETVSIYPESASDGLTQVLPSLQEGSFLVNYVGHGSVQQWGRDKLLTTEGVTELNNAGRLPIYINMTCLTGLFSHPTQESLAETLYFSSTGGAVALIAPTSLTLPTSQSKLNQTLLEQLLSADRPTVGDALMAAKRSVALTSNNEHDIVATFNLIGDPALRPVPMPSYQ